MLNTAYFPAERPFNPETLQGVLADTGSPLPAEAYVSHRWFDAERARLWSRNWVCVTAASYIPKPGDCIPIDLAGIPLFAVRDRNDTVHVYHNACPHRGMRLVSEPRNAGAVLTCPYHHWTFGFDGKLRLTPHIAGTGNHEFEGFEKSRFCLNKVRSAVWFDQVFVALSDDACSFDEFIAPLRRRWSCFDSSPLRHGGDDSILYFDLEANWKLAVENYCEAYHLPMIHPRLNMYSKLEDHLNIEESAFAGQVSLVYNPDRNGHVLPKFPALPSMWQSRAEYVALFPNVLLGIHFDHLFVVRVLPDGPGRCREVLDIYYVGDEPVSPSNGELRQTVRDTWREVFLEDVDAVQGMQAGRSSPGFSGGVFTPVLEGPSRCFHRWVANAMI